jgi:hypothetical protein
MKLLTEHFVPDKSFSFPKIFSAGCNRCFQLKWLEKYPWLVYSASLNGGFCKYCTLFVKDRSKLGRLVNKPFEKWVKVTEILDRHALNSYHINAVSDATEFILSIKNPQKTIDVCLSTKLGNNIQQNRHIVKCCVESVLFCGRQNIALRGDNEKLDHPGNPGNFLAYLKDMARRDPLLKSHLEHPRLRNATYLSPQIQNEIIDVLGRKIIQQGILGNVNKAKFFSIMADEITSFNKEIMPLCVRYVTSDNEIREDFLLFSCLSRITGQSMASTIFNKLEELGLEVKNIRGQGYDGASNMAGERIGLQALVRKKSPLAVYTHCSGHCLNLVVGGSCTLPVIRNVIDKIKGVCMFFLNSPKRNNLLIEVISKVSHPTKRAPLIDLCKTRWAARHCAYEHFYSCYTSLVTCCEVIGLGQHKDTLSDNFCTASWDAESKKKAEPLLYALLDFDFIVGFLVVYQLLSHLSGITVKLQSRSLDIVAAYNQISDVQSYYKVIRENIDSEFHKIYSQAERMAVAVNVQPSKPRSCGRQMNRPNVVTTTVEQWYKVNVAIPFVDHIITDLESRFSPLAKRASSLLFLVPSVLCTCTEVDFSSVVEMYSSDLPSPELFDQEVGRWKHLFMNSTKRPDICADALKACDSSFFPNIYVLLKIACTIPVTSCECERDASVVRRLHNHMRCTMSENRMTSLALMHIHYEHEYDLDDVVDLFARCHPRRLRLSNILVDPHNSSS